MLKRPKKYEVEEHWGPEIPKTFANTAKVI